MVYIDCWDRSTGFDDETSLNGATSYLFGLRPQGQEVLNGDVGFQYSQPKKLGQWYTTPSGGNYPVNNLTATFIPVNGVPFWHMYGKCTHTVADTTQTITSMTTTEGKKTTIKAFQQWDSNSKLDYFGLLTNSLNLSYDEKGLVVNQGMMGCKVAKSSATPTTPVLPDDSSNNEVTSPFNVFDSWTWNSNTMERPKGFNMQAKQNVTGYMKSFGAYYNELTEHMPIFTGFSAGVVGDTNFSNLWDDYWSKTTRTLTWKMLKANDVTKLFEVTASDCLCHLVTPIRKGGEILGYTANFISGNVSIVVTDNVDDDFYTIKT